jgi:hypothetical protein
MVIGLAKTLISLGVSLQRRCQLQEGWKPMVDAIGFQSAVVPVVDGGQKSLYVPGINDIVGRDN